jgi:hypothetical protein
MIIYSGDKNSDTEFGIILAEKWGRRIKNFLLYNDRITLIELKTDENVLLATKMKKWRKSINNKKT